MKNTFNQEQIKVLSEKHGLGLLLLFGSRVSGETHAMSDYDFGYLSQRTLGYVGQTDLQHDLARVVDSQNIEVVNLSDAGPFLLREIIKQHQVVFSKQDSYERFYSYAVGRYLDEQRLFDLDRILYQQTLEKYQKHYAQ